MQKSLIKCYIVKAEIINAMSYKGYRAAVYKMAEQHSGLYNPWNKALTIYYSDGGNLHITLLFKKETGAEVFQTSLSQWHLNNPLVVRPGSISVDRLLAEKYVEVCELDHVMLSDYVGNDSDSPVESLEAFPGLPSSRSNISVISQSDPLALFQSIEKPELFMTCKAYKMHLLSQSKYPKLARDSNNILAGSWTPLHQFFDGLNTAEEIPMIAIKPLSEIDFEEVSVGIPPEKRYKVLLEIEFRDEKCALDMENRFKDGSRKMSPTKWRSFVHVTDPTRFCKHLKFKCKATMKEWEEYSID